MSSYALLESDNSESDNSESGKIFEVHQKRRNIIKWLKFSLIGLFLAFLILGLLIFYIIFWKDFRTVLSIKNISNNSYYEMDYVSDYYFDDFLKVGASTDTELQQFLLKKLLKGFPISINSRQGFACSTFSITNPDGAYLFGRNFDWKTKTTPVLVHTKPGNGYESFSMCNMNFLGGNCDLNDFSGKLAALCLPYLPLDGINEKGVSVAVLQLDEMATKQNTGKVSITTSTAIRLILDKAANVEEALSLLQQYDMNSSEGDHVNFHFMIADSSGNSAIIEYTDDQIKIVRKEGSFQVCTNFKITDYLGQEITPDICYRYATYTKKLNEVNGVLSNEDAFQLLKSLSLAELRPGFGAWSIMYNNSKLDMKLSTADKMNKSFSYQFTNKIGNQNRVILIDWFILAFIPGVLIILGTVRKHKLTQYKRGLFILKSKKALSSKSTWFIAQDYLGKMCIKTGFVILVLSEAVVFLCRNIDIDSLAFLFIGIPVCQGISYIIPFLLTENKLTKCVTKENQSEI